MTNLEVRVNDVTFRGKPSLHDNGEGFFIGPDGLVGLDEGVMQRRKEVGRDHSAGSFDVSSYGAARTVVLSGWARAASPAGLGVWKRRLLGLLAEGQSARLLAVHQGLELEANCRLTGTTRMQTMRNSRRHADFQIAFWCADPRLYGPKPNTFGPATSVTAFHYGNVAALATLTVAGSMASGYTIHGPAGKLYTVTTPLVAGHPHTISMRDGYLRVDGVIIMGGYTQTDLWSIPAGAQVAMSLTGTGTGTLSAEVPDTYM